MEHKRNTYYDDPKDNTAFERCIDVMSRLMLKYIPRLIEYQLKYEKLMKEKGKG